MFIDLWQKHNLMELRGGGVGGGSKWRGEGCFRVVVTGWMALETENWFFFLAISSNFAHGCLFRVSPGKSRRTNDFTS